MCHQGAGNGYTRSHHIPNHCGFLTSPLRLTEGVQILFADPLVDLAVQQENLSVPVPDAIDSMLPFPRRRIFLPA